MLGRLVALSLAMVLGTAPIAGIVCDATCHDDAPAAGSHSHHGGAAPAATHRHAATAESPAEAAPATRSQRCARAQAVVAAAVASPRQEIVPSATLPDPPFIAPAIVVVRAIAAASEHGRESIPIDLRTPLRV